MSFWDNTGRAAARRWMSRHTRIGVGAVASGLLAAAVVSLAGPASASTSGPAGLGAAAVQDSSAVHRLVLRPMPHGVVIFGRAWKRQLTVHADIYGLTPGSSHNVDLVIPGRLRAVRFSRLTANSVGQVHSTLHSFFTGRLRAGSRLIVRMGTGSAGIAKDPIAVTRRLRSAGRRPHRLIAIEIGRGGTSFGALRGRATISYSARRKTLTVIVDASGLTPGPHAAHIHLGSCMSQGPVLYMLKDLVANARGQIRHAVRVFANVTTPIPPHGWYLNIHQGNSGNILSNGQPTIYFRPLLCANIRSS